MRSKLRTDRLFLIHERLRIGVIGGGNKSGNKFGNKLKGKPDGAKFFCNKKVLILLGKSRPIWSEWRDSNSRPLEPHSSTLPSCATPRLKTYLQAENIIPQRQDLSRVYFYGSTVMEERIMPIQQEYGNVPISAGVNSMMLSPGARPF